MPNCFPDQVLYIYTYNIAFHFYQAGQPSNLLCDKEYPKIISCLKTEFFFVGIKIRFYKTLNGATWSHSKMEQK
jgi:hypothetical protein